MWNSCCLWFVCVIVMFYFSQMIKRYIYDHDGHIKMNTWILKHDFFFWLSNEHACGNFFFTRHVYPTEKFI